MHDLEKHLTRKSTKKDDLPAEVYPLTDLDKGLVGWDAQDDPENPRNFPHKRKLFILFLVSAITFLSPLASSIFAPGIPFVNADFNNTSQMLGSFAVSVYILGFAVSICNDNVDDHSAIDMFCRSDHFSSLPSPRSTAAVSSSTSAMSSSAHSPSVAHLLLTLAA